MMSPERLNFQPGLFGTLYILVRAFLIPACHDLAMWYSHVEICLSLNSFVFIPITFYFIACVHLIVHKLCILDNTKRHWLDFYFTEQSCESFSIKRKVQGRFLGCNYIYWILNTDTCIFLMFMLVLC